MIVSKRLSEEFSKPFDVDDLNVIRRIDANYKSYEKIEPELLYTTLKSETDSSGRFVCQINGVKYSCVLLKGKGEYLYVIYNGARSYQYDYIERPQIPRCSYINLVNGSILGIDDPMYYVYNDLKLGWYYGNRDRFYLQESLSIVSHISNKIDICSENICFLGSSGGGYASLMASSMLDDTFSISINPQLVLKNWWYSKHFSSITGIDLCQKEKYNRNDIGSVLKNSKSKHIIVVNIASFQDYVMQLVPILKELGILRLRMGLNVYEHILIWLYYAPSMESAHTAFEVKSMFSYINEIALAYNYKDDFDIDYYQEFALSVNMIWYDICLIRNKNYLELTRNIEIIQSISLNQLRKFKSYDDVVLPASKNKYNYYAIQGLKKNGCYCIQCKSIKLIGSNRITYGLYDFMTQKIIKYYTCIVAENIEMCFKIGSRSEGIAFCIYAGEISHTEDVELYIANITVYERG